jgi:hypothetical protein
VTSGRECIGHIIARGRLGFEAFDHADLSLGVFSDITTAANACELAARKREGAS